MSGDAPLGIRQRKMISERLCTAAGAFHDSRGQRAIRVEGKNPSDTAGHEEGLQRTNAHKPSCAHKASKEACAAYKGGLRVSKGIKCVIMGVCAVGIPRLNHAPALLLLLFILLLELLHLNGLRIVPILILAALIVPALFILLVFLVLLILLPVLVTRGRVNSR